MRLPDCRTGDCRTGGCRTGEPLRWGAEPGAGLLRARSGTRRGKQSASGVVFDAIARPRARVLQVFDSEPGAGLC